MLGSRSKGTGIDDLVLSSMVEGIGVAGASAAKDFESFKKNKT